MRARSVVRHSSFVVRRKAFSGIISRLAEIGNTDMSSFETRSSQFGLVSGIRQASSDMVLVAEPAGLFAPEARKGQLYIIAEADQDVARGRDACQLVSRTIRKL